VAGGFGDAHRTFEQQQLGQVQSVVNRLDGIERLIPHSRKYYLARRNLGDREHAVIRIAR
jgi:hypothetical protein